MSYSSHIKNSEKIYLKIFSQTCGRIIAFMKLNSTLYIKQIVTWIYSHKLTVQFPRIAVKEILISMTITSLSKNYQTHITETIYDATPHPSGSKH